MADQRDEFPAPDDEVDVAQRTNGPFFVPNVIPIFSMWTNPRDTPGGAAAANAVGDVGHLRSYA
jgi:hypothetical protein